MARGLSQKQVAEHLGVTVGQLQKYERSASRITASVLYRAADLFDVGVDAFYIGLRTPAPVSPFTLLSGRRREGVIVIPLTAGVAAAYVQEDELINVAVSYQQIRNPSLRAPIRQLVRRLAQETEID